MAISLARFGQRHDEAITLLAMLRRYPAEEARGSAHALWRVRRQ